MKTELVLLLFVTYIWLLYSFYEAKIVKQGGLPSVFNQGSRTGFSTSTSETIHSVDHRVSNGLSSDQNVDDHTTTQMRSSLDQSCTYTFHVSPSGVDTCPPGSKTTRNTGINPFTDSIVKQLDDLTKFIQSLDKKNSNSNDIGDENDDKGENNLINEQTSSVAFGTHYVRWGSTSCQSTAEILYKGYAAKSHSQHGGGGNFLCLPDEPEFPKNAGTGLQSQSYIYGVEYEHHNSPVIPKEKQDHDVPCVMCHVTGRGEQLMIPAKNTCPVKWTLEYEGILMAQHHRHRSSDFICVDKSMEVLQGGSINLDGGLLYAVEVRCGSLKCPPYEEGKEMSCSVCTL